MRNLYIVYHKIDFDGVCSAACVYWLMKPIYNKIHLVPINHGEEFDLWGKITPMDVVYMVDFCLPIDEMKKLNKFIELHVIDHHITAINAIKESGENFSGCQEIGIGACYLTYQYVSQTDYCPYIIKLLAEYDVWNHSDVNALPLQYGLKCIDDILNPKNELWERIVCDKVSDTQFLQIIKQENYCQQYEKMTNKLYCDIMAFDSDLDGFKLLCVNKALSSSILFESKWDNTVYDIMCCFNRVNGTWSVSLYTDKEGVDVSKIAKKYGGGGHKQAAGFGGLQELPFKV